MPKLPLLMPSIAASTVRNPNACLASAFALDTKTAKVLWQGPLPANGNRPGVYMVDGKEYVVLAAGPRGGGGAARAGAAPPAAGGYIAFALPD